MEGAWHTRIVELEKPSVAVIVAVECPIGVGGEWVTFHAEKPVWEVIQRTLDLRKPRLAGRVARHTAV